MVKLLKSGNSYITIGGDLVQLTDPLQGFNVFEDFLFRSKQAALEAYNVPDHTDARFTSVIYVDPDSVTNGVGTENDPLNAYPSSFVANTAYLQKRGTTANISTDYHTADAVMLGAYGVGERPELVIVDEKRLVLMGDTLIIRDVKINNLSIGKYPYVLSDQHYVYNCECEFIGIFGSLTWTRVIGNEIHGSDGELIWMSGADLESSVGYNVEVAWNNMYDANMAWFPGATQGEAPGDAIQFSGANGLVHIHHNIIDRSSTGNKFNIILGEPSSPAFDALIEHNVFYPPLYTDQGGTVMYLKTIIGECTIRNNVFVNKGVEALGCIHSEDGDMDFYGNLMIGLDFDVNRGINSYFNNTIIDCNSLNAPYAAEHFNNIFSTNIGGAVGANNLLVDEELPFSIFKSLDTYKIFETSVAKGTGISSAKLSEWIVDFWGKAQGTGNDVGSFRF